MPLHWKGVLLVCLFSCVQADDLLRWKNDQIEAIRTATPAVGETLIIGVKHREEFLRSSCKFYPPTNDLGIDVWYKVIDGVVYDNNDEVVNGIEAWDDGGDLSTCGIKILEMADFHDENDNVLYNGWRIDLYFQTGGILGQEKLNQIEVEIHIKEEFLRPLLETRFGLKPFHYDLSLIPDLTSTSDVIHFQGNVKISMKIADYPGFIIPVQMKGLDIRNLNGTATRKNSKLTEILEFQMIYYNLQEDLVILFASNELFDIGDIVAPEIKFESGVHQDGYGIGLYKEYCDKYSEKFCWFTQFEATGARDAFPCHDEPGAKAIFDIKVARTEGWNTLGNMPIIETEPVEDMEGWVWDIFDTSPKMTTYTVAFAIQDFEAVSASGNMTIWATKAFVDAGYADYASVIGPDCITFMSDLFSVKYTLPKMDMMSVPNFAAGAMENWGLVLYEFDYLMYDQNNPDEDKKWDVLETVAHELVHQWFGNLVTMHWWDQTWLNEGFAEYFAFVVADALDSTSNSWDRFVSTIMLSVMTEDSSDRSWAISDPVVSNEDIDRKFGDITYYKGGSLIRMMESFLGADTLIKGLSSYLRDMSYMSVVEDDLFMYLEAAGLVDGKWPQDGVEDLAQTMKTWTQQAGLPLVTVKKITENGKTMVVASQSWYKDGTVGSTDQLWDIPITIVDLAKDDNDWDNATPDVWLTDVTIELPATEDTTPLLNKKAMGYYRVNYSPEIWSDIANILLSNHQAIHPFNRAQIICDVTSLASNGYLDTETMNLVLQYYETETDFAPIRAFNQCQLEVKTAFKRI